MPQVAALSMSPKVDTPDAIGGELRAALPGMRMYSLSLHDAEGDVLWLSEGVLGPDKHGVVLDAMNGQSLDPKTGLVDRPLGDGRNALILPARNTAGDVVAAAMLIVDTKQISGELLRKLASGSVTEALAKLAARQPASTRTPRSAPAPVPLTPKVVTAAPAPPPLAAESPVVLELAPDEPRRLPPRDELPGLSAGAARDASRPPSGSGSPRSAVPVAKPRASGSIKPSKAPVAAAAPAPKANPAVKPAVNPATNSVPTVGAKTVARPAPRPAAPAAAAPVPAPIPVPVRAAVAFREPEPEPTLIAPKPEIRDLTLVVQQLLKLRSGGRTRRYEVLLRSRSDPSREAVPATLMQAVTASDATSAIDRYVLGELVKWLGRHREVWEAEPSSFTVNLSATALRDRGFLQFAAALTEEWKVAPGVVGFEIPERACIEGGTEIREFVERCEQLGFFLALDDFSMHSSAVPLLASPAVRLVKIDARLTLEAMTDKLSQALVIAISQAAKVLGVHCVAKRIESAMARQWLSAIGIDFAQGFALERPQTLDALLTQTPTSAAPARPV